MTTTFRARPPRTARCSNCKRTRQVVVTATRRDFMGSNGSLLTTGGAECCRACVGEEFWLERQRARDQAEQRYHQDIAQAHGCSLDEAHRIIDQRRNPNRKQA